MARNLADKKVISFPEKEVKRLRRGKVDSTFLVLTVMLVALGLLCLYSASYADALYHQNGNTGYYVLRQGLFAGMGLVVMFLASKFDYRNFKKLALPVFIASVALLASIFLTKLHIINGLWKTINKATRWINLGFTTFQPSELAKFAVILMCATLASSTPPKKMKTVKYGILPYMAIGGIIAALLYVEPHMSATIIILAIIFVIMFLGGTNMLYIGGVGVLGGGAMAYLIFSKGYATERIRVWRDPFSDFLGKGWQGAQSLITVGTGGFWGLGLGQGKQKQLFLPEPANDFIFAVICEELGFVGAVLILIVFAALICRGYMIALRAPDRFGTLLAAGITTQVAIQVILNVFVVTGIIPVTGVALPFFSYGGTSLMMLLGEMGVLMNISRAIPEVEK